MHIKDAIGTAHNVTL